MFERFTPDARKAVVLAQEESRRLRQSAIGTEHVLLGLLANPESTAASVLSGCGASLEAARSLVEAAVGWGASEPGAHIPFTSQAQRTLELSLRQALQLGDNFIGTEHILLGLIGTEPGVAHEVLAQLCGGATAAREAMLAHIAGTPRVATRMRVGLELGVEPPARPEWYRPPADLLPAVVPLGLVIGRSPTVAIALSELRVYPVGAELSLLFRSRTVRGEEFMEQVLRSGRAADDGLLLEVAFADGQHASTRAPVLTDAEIQPNQLAMIAGGGFGGGELWYQEYWMRPLPPEGDVAVTCEWLEVGISRTETTVDGAAMRAAADRARGLWD